MQKCNFGLVHHLLNLYINQKSFGQVRGHSGLYIIDRLEILNLMKPCVSMQCFVLHKKISSNFSFMLSFTGQGYTAWIAARCKSLSSSRGWPNWEIVVNNQALAVPPGGRIFEDRLNFLKSHETIYIQATLFMLHKKIAIIFLSFSLSFGCWSNPAKNDERLRTIKQQRFAELRHLDQHQTLALPPGGNCCFIMTRPPS